MKVFFLTVLLLATVMMTTSALVVASKTIEKGSSGPDKAIAAKESTLPDFVVYRPREIKTAS